MLDSRLTFYDNNVKLYEIFDESPTHKGAFVYFAFLHFRALQCFSGRIFFTTKNENIILYYAKRTIRMS